MDLGGIETLDQGDGFAKALNIVLDNAKLSLTRLERLALKEKQMMYGEIDRLYQEQQVTEDRWRAVRTALDNRVGVSKASLSFLVNAKALPSRETVVVLIRTLKKYYAGELVELCDQAGIPLKERPKFTRKHAEYLLLLAGHALPQEIERASTWTQELQTVKLPDDLSPRVRHTGQYQRKRNLPPQPSARNEERDTGPMQAIPSDWKKSDYWQV